MIVVTELAASKIKEILVSQNKEDSYLRLYVAGIG